MAKKLKELRFTHAHELRVQDGADGSKTISGTAVVYNSPSVDMGGWTEIVAPGAFTETLKNSDVRMLRDHDTTLLLGREKSKTLTLTDTPQGLTFRCKLPNTTQAADLAESIKRGDLDGVSFGFTVAENGDKWSNTKGQVVRTLLAVELAEISIVSFPAYPATSVSIRSCPAELRSLIEQRKTNRDEDQCSCPCPECVDGDCADCSDEDCDYEGCSCIPYQERAASTVLSTSEVNKLQMKFALAKRK
jgi:HK97 family phage prohead protease